MSKIEYDRNIIEAEKEALRFVEKIKEFKEDQSFNSVYASSKRAAVKRASMDMTRALSKMRKSRWGS